MENPKIVAKGRLTAVLTKPDGQKIEIVKDNLVVDGGIDLLCDALATDGTRPAVLGYLGIGDDTTAAAAGDTALGNELDRNTTSYTHNTGESSFVLSATFAAGEGTGDITEAGLFNAAAAGTMFNRVVFTAIPKQAGDSLDMTFTITFTPA